MFVDALYKSNANLTISLYILQVKKKTTQLSLFRLIIQ